MYSQVNRKYVFFLKTFLVIIVMAASIPRDSFLKTEMTRSQLNSFQSDNLEMDEKYSRECGEAVDRVVRFLQQNVPLRVEKVLKVSGGTSVV